MQFESVGSVVGAAAFQMGYRLRSCAQWASSNPEPILAPSAENFYNQVWSTAVERLEQHAREMQADGVVGVTVDRRVLPDGGYQLTLSGTAVRHRSLEPLPTPFLSALPMGEFLKLLVAGWVPAGIAWGNAAVHVHGTATSAWRQGVQGRNAEMYGPTAGINAARERVEAFTRASLRRSLARGVVGMSVTINRESQGCTGSKLPGMLIIAHALGTGVVRYRDPVASISTGRRLSDGRAS